LPLSHSERRALELAADALRKELPGCAGEIDDILHMLHQPLSVFEAVLPDVRNLHEEERYLLHHWLTMSSGSPPEAFETALPVWYVVTPVVEDRYLTGWNVIRRNICPWCGDPVTPNEITSESAGRDKWELPHGFCREAWEKTGWRLPDSETGTEEAPAQTPSPGGHPCS
jgi:hypothetical protein